MCLNMDCKTKEEWRKKAEAKATAAENVSTGMEKQPELVGKAPIAEEKAVLVSKKAKKPAAKPAKKKVR
jgi:hypothetical protein